MDTEWTVKGCPFAGHESVKYSRMLVASVRSARKHINMRKADFFFMLACAWLSMQERRQNIS